MELKIFSTVNQINDFQFEEFYGLLTEAFPQNELRTKESFYALCKLQKNFKIISYLENGKLIAFFTLWEFNEFFFGDYFAVSKEQRNRGLGKNLLNEVYKITNRPLIIEVELPSEEMAKRRINFYLRNGFCENSYPYILPPMQKGYDGVEMQILSYPRPISENEFNKIKETLYNDVYKVKES